jgi:large subunit ribosomal protein L10
VGPTALTFVRGDVATAAKTLAEYGRSIQLLEFKGGVMDGAALDSDQLRALSRLPSREVLYGQLVGVVASPVSGLVRTLNALLGGLAAALGQVRDKMQTGEIPPGAPAAAEQATPDAQEPEPESAEEAEASEAPEGEAQAADESEPPSAEEAEASEAPEGEAQAVQEGESAAAQEPEASAAPEGEAQAAQEGEAAGAAASESQEGEPGEPAAEQDQDDTQASGEASSDAAEPAKEE